MSPRHGLTLDRICQIPGTPTGQGKIMKQVRLRTSLLDLWSLACLCRSRVGSRVNANKLTSNMLRTAPFRRSFQGEASWHGGFALIRSVPGACKPEVICNIAKPELHTLELEFIKRPPKV